VSLVGSLHHVALDVADTEEAARFYEDVLGFTPIERPDFGFPGAWFAAGDIQLHLLEVTDHQVVGFNHFALRVDDIDAVVARMVEQGVEVGPPSDGFPGAGRQAFLKDPSGNTIELNQPDPAG
jgi:catechol 2,3-dioxygenase-like lactoylglutathione lyase family enzyme